ncbi:protein kinase domain-containing protein [Dactylosporangium darangshiense]|uniref:non-specific serine/threonine protein kinase n=1 Tax=Dactylosporangium darangshiense TaxID=579108 RepID=A0ABP8DRA4_9ACTN
MTQGALLDLVCGPASPLPETFQRYRLVAHLGSGGQADVYRAVRICGGVTSAPMTVKVFRVDPQRPIADELRSWDKGDAALMDLNNRGVPGICRRADGFYGPPPHRPGERPAPGDAVPYQVYDYLHGVNLREYVVQRSAAAPGARRLNAVSALKTLAVVLQNLHEPQESGATPVLHMDVKPSNLMVLATGEVRLIDFTGARYFREEEITQIAYTPESGGPEAFGGVKYVGPAYDVHGFGAVAYFMVTGAYPRVDGRSDQHGPPDASPPPWNVLRRHPLLERVPALRDHLHAPLADRPADRPLTRELPAWLAGLAELVRRAGLPDVGCNWQEGEATESGRAVGRARPSISGTETDAYQRIERLERELVALRSAASPVNSATAFHQPVPPSRPVSAPPVSGPPVSGQPVSGMPVSPGGVAVNAEGVPQMRGVAKVIPRAAPDPTGMMPAEPEEDYRHHYVPARGERARQLKIGWRYTGVGAMIAFICWALWALDSEGSLTGPFIAFLVVLAVAVGVFALARLLGRLIIEQRLGRPRRTANGAHAITGLFLTVAGIAYLREVGLVVSFTHWVKDLIW